MRINLSLLNPHITISEAEALAKAVYIASGCKLEAAISRAIYPDKEYIILKLESTREK